MNQNVSRLTSMMLTLPTLHKNSLFTTKQYLCIFIILVYVSFSLYVCIYIDSKQIETTNFMETINSKLILWPIK